MPLTRNFKETIQARAQRDPEFRRELLREGIECILSGDIETGKVVLRDFVNAVMGFEKLAQATALTQKSLMRMLGPKGNPSARNLCAMLRALQKRERVYLGVVVKQRSRLRAGAVASSR
jgi:DNA-binding phage protein